MESNSRKEAILQAALEEFSYRSYDEASLNAILKSAGSSKGSFYYHFNDKKDLYLSLLRSGVEAKWEFIRNRTDQQSAGSGDIFQLFRLQAQMGVEFAYLFPSYDRLGRMYLKEKGNPIYREAGKLLGEDSERILAGMIDRAIAGNTFDKAFPREFLVKLFTYLFTHFEEILDAGESQTMEEKLNDLDLLISFIQQGAERR